MRDTLNWLLCSNMINAAVFSIGDFITNGVHLIFHAPESQKITIPNQKEIPVPTVTFEYAALYYLNWWLERDSKLCDGLASENQATKLESLKKAATDYAVARNLPRAFDVENGIPRFKPVLDVLSGLSAHDFIDPNTLAMISSVSEQISMAYGQRGSLSLTTKFLWLCFKKPIIIYDSNVCNALEITNKDLQSYYAAWRARYNEHAEAINSACNLLPTICQFCIDPMASPDDIENISSNEWFHERVLDIFLWYWGT